MNLILTCFRVQVRNQEDVHGHDVQTERALVIGGGDFGFEIVFIFTGVNAEVLLADLVSDTVFDCRPEHHLVTFHEVDHGVLKLGFIIFVQSVELDVVISDNLDSLVAFDEVYEAPDIVQTEVLRPAQITRDLVQLDLEKEDVT